jgi:hypothetical protein
VFHVRYELGFNIPDDGIVLGGYVVPLFIHLGSSWRRMLSFTLRPIYL